MGSASLQNTIYDLVYGERPWSSGFLYKWEMKFIENGKYKRNVRRPPSINCRTLVLRLSSLGRKEKDRNPIKFCKRLYHLLPIKLLNFPVR